MRKVKKLPRAAFLGEKFPQKCVIYDCFQFMKKVIFKIFKLKYDLFRLMCDLNGLILQGLRVAQAAVTERWP